MDFYCPKCKKQAFTTKNGPHHELYCLECGHIKFLPQPIQDFVMPFGKCKGMKLVDCEIDYLQWLIQNVDKKNIVKKATEAIRYKIGCVHVKGKKYMVYDGRYNTDPDSAVVLDIFETKREAEACKIDYGEDCVVVETMVEDL